MANFTVTQYPHGTFSWVDCNSTNPDKAIPFYAEVMGWTTEAIPMGNGMDYTMFRKDGHKVAGLGPAQEGMPSVWMSYVNVENVDALAAKIPELGGKVVMEPIDVFEEGRMLLLQDPTGAFVGLWQAKNHIGSGLVNVPGSVTWNELLTNDLQKAEDFFTKLLGWEVKEGPFPGYRIPHVKGRANGGMMLMGEGFGGMPPMWIVYFSVEDIDAVVAKVPTLGGKVRQGVAEAPGVGRFAVIEDPAGGVSTMMQVNEPEPWTK